MICLLIMWLSPWSLGLGNSSTSAEAKDDSYVWPMEKVHKLSSTFAEHRSFHFHSGIDIPTEKKTGYKVFACQSGYVYRLFTSWWGYGKAVYLKLDDGRFAVYGHLSDFSERISEVVRSKQLETKRYEADFLPQANAIRVEKGEIIGYSGESGRGGAHLHFELRDSTGHPINPLTSGFSMKDGFPPVVKYLAIRPLGIGAKVNGSAKPAIFTPVHDPQENIYGLSEAPVVDGEIGLELSVYDRMEASRFNFGIYGIALFLDDSLLFSCRYDETSFENTHQVELDRDFEFTKKEGKMFHKLFVEEGNDLPIYNPAGGKINTETARPGPHKVEIRAFDAAGNSSTLAFSLVFDQSPLILSCFFEEEKAEQKIKVRFDDLDDAVHEILVEKSCLSQISWEQIKLEKISMSHGEHVFGLTQRLDEPVLLRMTVKDGYGAFSEKKYLSVNLEQLERSNETDSLEVNFEYYFTGNLFIFDLEFNQILREVPQFSLKSGGFNFDPLFREQLDEKSYRLTFPFFLTQPKQMSLLVEGVNLFGHKVTLVRNVPVAIITKSFGGEAGSADGEAKVRFAPDVVYEDVNVNIHSQTVESEPRHRLVGEIYSFQPSTVPLDGWARISLRYPEEGCDPHKLALYELTPKEAWRFVEQELDSLTRTVEGEVRHLSVFALVEDTLPPQVTRVSISAGERIQEKRPKITAEVKDDLSGIGSDEDVLMEMDGEWMIPEYDPEQEILSTRPILPLTLGKHLLTISVKDRARNETKMEREFFVIGK